ncbi:hypothetical protein K523DRAFT_58151 [Schizophyllum commune Tattone D]|nr:hypothetical protein K523DRAFT_58151 [Schizophyllum commune Tattone D]
MTRVVDCRTRIRNALRGSVHPIPKPFGQRNLTSSTPSAWPHYEVFPAVIPRKHTQVDNKLFKPSQGSSALLSPMFTTGCTNRSSPNRVRCAVVRRRGSRGLRSFGAVVSAMRLSVLSSSRRDCRRQRVQVLVGQCHTARVLLRVEYTRYSECNGS